jgi:DNA repair protein RecO (recombination protein O)
MIEKTEGVVLRVTPFSQTSHIISWLTLAHGRMAAIAKGAQRQRSFFLGQYALFYTCEIVFYPRESGSLSILKECSPLKNRLLLRERWRSVVSASYLCDLISRVVPPGGHHVELYDLLDSGLDFLNARGTSDAFLHWFELRLLKAVGLAPQLSKCTVCGRSVSPTDDHASFFCSGGGIVCVPCGERQGASIRIAPDVLGVLRNWQNSESPEIAERVLCSERQLKSVCAIVRAFLRHHLEMPTQAAAIASEAAGKQLPDLTH